MVVVAAADYTFCSLETAIIDVQACARSLTKFFPSTSNKEAYDVTALRVGFAKLPQRPPD